MKIKTFKEASSNWEKTFEEAKEYDITITKDDKPFLCIVNFEEYKKSMNRLLQLELDLGIRQLENGEFSEFNAEELIEKAKRNLK